MTEVVVVSSGCTRREGSGCGKGGGGGDQEQQQQASVIELVLSALRKSVVACTVDESEDVVTTAVRQKMEIGYPTDVKHITHVTFDRFNGFLGLPVELEVEIPTPVPSASASVFGVSPESMQCCYDSRGNSVPKILLLMQERLYSQDGLKAEGIFRINPENSEEEIVRDQLNKGIVPDDIDVHCLAGLIKAWFRELPSGVLDGLLPEQVLRCSVEEEFVELTNLLQPTQSALLNWAVELMADVVEEEELNKMNARNIAMVFAPNMTQMSDPLTALMHAVQVINFLKALILKTLRDREGEESWSSSSSPASDSYHFCIQRANDYVNGEQTVSSDDEAGDQISDRNSSDDEHGGDDLTLLNDKDDYDGSDYSDHTSEEDDNDNYSSSDEEIAKMKEKPIFLIEWKVEEDDDGDDEATTTSFSDLHVSGTTVSGSASSKQESSGIHTTVTDEEDSERSVDKCVVEVPVRPEKQDGGDVDVEIVKCLLEP